MPNSESSSSPVRRGLVYGLSLLLIWQPVLLSAQPITPTHSTKGRPTLDQAANGVPVVNIKNPNGKGVSQNDYHDFNVGQEGAILNNSQQLIQTQLGGYIEGNPNLQNGSARLILNEVVGSNPSALNGYLEVAGARADVVVANPNGISCNGCGFINTDHATLTTGRALMDGDGGLSGFDVQQGNIRIHGDGLNASNTDRFDLIARSVKVAADLHANELNVVTGKQEVDRQTLAIRNASSDDDRPQFAIDSSELGGMYAGRIRLVANEDGVGVRLNAPVAAQNGDLQLSSNGNLRFSDASAKGNVQLASAQTLVSTGTVAAGNTLSMQGRNVRLKGEQASARQVDIRADHTVVESGASVLGVETLAVTGNRVTNEGELTGDTVTVQAAKRIDNLGTVLANADATLETGALANNGTVNATGDLTVTTDQSLTNDGDLVSGQALNLKSGNTLTNNGQVFAQGDLTVNAASVANNGQLHSGSSQTVTATTVTNTGSLVAADSLTVTADTFTQQTVTDSEASLESGGDLTLTASTLNNDARIATAGNATLTTSGDLTNQGDITAEGTLDLQVGGELVNRGDVLGLSNLTVNAQTLSNEGSLQAMNDLTATADQVVNRGVIQANSTLSLASVVARLLNQGKVEAGQALHVQASALTNGQGAELLAGQQLDLIVTDTLTNRGLIQAGQPVTSEDAEAPSLTLNTAHLNNNASGTLQSYGTLTLGEADAALQSLKNRGQISSDQAMSLTVSDVTNHQGATLQSRSDLSLHDADALTNQGVLIGHGVLSLEAQTILNERLASAPEGAFDGTLGSLGEMTIHSETLTNQGGALLGAGGNLNLLVRDRLLNDLSDIVARGDLLIAAAMPAFTAGMTEEQRLEALKKVKNNAVINHSGQIVSDNGSLRIATRYLDNSRNVILAKDYDISAGELMEATVQEMLENPDAEIALMFDNADLSEEDWTFMFDPDVYKLPFFVAGDSDTNRFDFVRHWVHRYTDYLNSQIDGLLSRDDIRYIRSKIIEESKPINVAGDKNPLAETFYLIPRIAQIIKARSPDKYVRLYQHMQGKVENHKEKLHVWQSVCSNRTGMRTDWISSSSRSCDNGFLRFHLFGEDRYDDVIDPASDAIPSLISANNKITIHADTLDNRYSTLTSGGDMLLSGDKLLNEAVELKRHYTLKWGEISWHNDGPSPYWRPREEGEWVVSSWENPFTGEVYEHKSYLASDYTGEEQKEVQLWVEDKDGKRLRPKVVSSVISTGGALTLDFTDEVGNYTTESEDEAVEFDDKQYALAPPEGSEGGGTVSGEEPTYTDWGDSDVARAIDTINARTLALLEKHSSLFLVNRNRNHPYLIETNPLFNTLDGFLGSGYLIDRLGLDPDMTSRRLGDSYYENTLIRDAVLAATGTRFLDPNFNSDKDQFQWLMDNALAAAESMELAVGVSLTPVQINALQQDMVWLEEKDVAGFTVLVPVLYLAPGSQQLTNQGAVIAGNQVNITTDGLGNSGMIASNQNLVVNAGDKGVVNLEGTLQAGGQLLVDSRGDIKNQSGTVRGNGVVLQSQGDIINEAWSERIEDDWSNGTHWRTQHGEAGVIESSGDVVLNAGENIQITGSQISGETVGMQAGGNIEIGSLRVDNGFDGQANGGDYQYNQVRQLGSEINATLNLMATAGQSIGITASNLNAGGNIGLTALQGDIVIQAAANEDYEHSYYKDSEEERTRTDHTVRQQQSALSAGGNMSLDAGNNLVAIAAKLESGGDMRLKAGNNIALLAAQNSDYHFAETEKEGDYGSHSYRKDEVQKVTNLTTELNAGGNLVIDSDGDQHYQAARLESGGDITLKSGGHITFESVKDLVRETHEKSSGDLSWNKMSGEGTTDETLLQTAIVAQGNLAIDAAQGLTIDVKEVDQATVSEMIDGMVANNPDLAWLKEAEARGDVDWKQVQEMHDSWDYESQSMGAASALVVAIVVTVLTAGAGAAAVNGVAAVAAPGATAAAAATGTTVAASGFGATAAAVSGAVITGAATTGASTLINNQGDLGATLDSLDHSGTYQSLAVSGVTAGLMSGLDGMFSKWNYGKVETNSLNNITKGFDLNSAEGIAGFTLHNTAQAGIQAGVSSSIYGTSFSDAFKASLESQGNNVLSAVAFNQVGNLGDYLADSSGQNGNTTGFNLFVEGGLGRTTLHALAGGAVTEITSGDFASGAAGAGLNQILSGSLSSAADGLGNGDPSKTNAWRVAGSQLAGLAGAAAVDGDVNEGAWIAKQADTYNRQLHREELKLIKDNYKEYAEEHGLSEGEALKELTEQAMAMVDEEWNKELFIDPESGKRAEAWLNQLGAGNTIQGADGQATGQQYFAATDEQYQNQLLNLGQVTAPDAAYNPFQHVDGNVNNVMQAAAHDGSRLNSAEAAYDLVNLQYGGNYQAFVDDAKALVPTLMGQFQTAKQDLQAIKDANPDMSFDDLMNTQEYRDLKHLQQGLLYSANLLNNPALPQDDLELDDIRRGVNLYNSTVALGLGNGANRPPKLGVLKGLEPPFKVVRNPIRGSESNLVNKVDDNPNVKWVDENASMSDRARNYDDSATGSRSNVETQKGQAPTLHRTLSDGTQRPVKFDGFDDGVLVDRKISVVTTPKAKDQVLRQSQALSENGLTGRWEVPTQVQLNRAQKMFNELGVTNIEVKVVPEP